MEEVAKRNYTQQVKPCFQWYRLNVVPILFEEKQIEPILTFPLLKTSARETRGITLQK